MFSKDCDSGQKWVKDTHTNRLCIKTVREITETSRAYSNCYNYCIGLISGYPLRGKHQCVCDLYEIILIIIIISLGQILLSHIANTSRPHARTPTAIAIQVVAVRWVGGA